MSSEARQRKLADRIKVIVAETLEKRIKDPRLGFVTITDVPPGTHDGTIVVHTNVPEYSELRVPLRVDGLASNDEHPPRK